MARDGDRSPFNDFDERLRRLKGEPAKPDEDDAGGRSSERMSFGDGLQVGVELVAGVFGGFAIGWFLDRWLETTPLFIVVFFLLGAAAGTLNAYRWLRRFGLAGAARDAGRPADSAPRERGGRGTIGRNDRG